MARLNCLIISNAHKKFHHRNYVFVTSDITFFDKLNSYLFVGIDIVAEISFERSLRPFDKDFKNI